MADVVDHIQPLSKGGDPWMESNLRCLYKNCHDAITAAMKRNISPEMAIEERKWREIVDSPVD